MQTANPFKIGWFLAGLVYCGLGTAQAQTVTNADAAVTLNLGGSWVGGTPAGSANVAVWDHTVQVNTTKALGANLSWAGIKILDPAALVTISAGNTLTLGASGIDLSAATNGLTLSAPVVLGANQTWNVTNGLTLTAGGAVSGSSLLTLNNGGNNGGTIILGVANTYTGGTVINSGIAQPNTITSFGTGMVTNNGGTLLLSVFPSAGVMVNGFNVTGTSLIDMFNRSVSDVLDGAWSGNGTILITNDTASGSTLTFGGASGGNMANFTGSIIVVTNASGTPSAGTIRFNNGGSQVNTGNSAMSVNLGTNSTVILGNRDPGTTSIGELTGGPGTIVKGPTGAAGTEVWSIGAKNTSVTFAGSFVNNAANEIAALTKVGTGTLTLTGTNTGTSTGPTGATAINAGTLQIGDGNADGTLLGGAVVNSSALVFNRPDTYTVTNNISGSGTVTIQGGGTNTYTGNNSSSGTTIISTGDLVLVGTMSCPISVASAGTFDVSQISFNLNQSLSGSGIVTGLVTAVGGSINPGGTSAAGNLTFLSGLTESGNVNNQLELSTPAGTNDFLTVVGNLTLNGTNIITLSHFGGGAIPSGTYPLIGYTGTLSGGTSNFTVIAVGVSGTLTNITTTTPPEIAVVISPAARGATSLAWVGDGVANNWDIGTSNWVNGATFFAFQAGDSVIFNDSGAPNTNVTVAVTVQPASVTVSNIQHYTFSGGGNISGSTGLTKTNAGTLSILATNSYTGPTVVGAGTLEVFNVANGGSASAIGAATSNPTNLVFYGSVFKYSGGSAAMDRSATLNGAGVTVDVASGVNLTENGSFTGIGALTKVDNGTLTLATANTYTGGTVISNGVLATANDTANGAGFGPTSNPITLSGGTLALYRNNGDDGSTTYTFNNPVVVPAGQTGSLLAFQRGNYNGTLTGSGTLNITASGQRAGFDSDWSAFTGVINVTGNFRIGNNFGYANAVINLNDGADLDGGNASGTYSTSPIFDIGELDGTSLATLGAVSKPSPNPTWRVGWKNTTSIFAGTIENPAGGAGSITKVGIGTWYLSGQNTFSGSTTISNGVLALTNGVNGDGSIGNSTNIYINAGAFLDVSGRSDTKLPLNSGQVLAGNGTLNGLLDTTPGGTVSAGGGLTGATGVLTVTNAVTLGGTAWLKLNRSSSPTSDKLVSPSSITYGGTLVLTNIGTRFMAGDTFTLFSGGGLSGGSFSSIVLPNYYTWNLSQLGVNGTVRVTAVLPPPSFSNVDFSQLANGTITLNAINGSPSGPVTILTTTNLALPLSSWTTVVKTAFDGSGNLNYSATVDPTLPQSYFLLQAQ
jgi:fibronectin-binding autotransporter adhesin